MDALTWPTLRFPPLRPALARLLAAWCLAPVLAAAAPVTLQLKWYHQFQFAGYYAAKALGYYREAGLEVRIVEGRPGLQPVAEVLAGRAQFGVGDSALLLARAAGRPVVVLGVIFQHSPEVLLVRRMGPGVGLQSLAGRRVMVDADDSEMVAFLRREGLPLDRLRRVQHDFRIQDLMEGRVEACSGYLANEPYDLDRAGFPYQAFSPRAADIDFYGDNLFTSEQELRAHPDQVKAFRSASLRGWQYAMAHPDLVAELILRQYSTRENRGHLLYQAQQLAPLLQADLVEMGYMNPDRWRRIADTYAELGMVGRNLPLDGFLFLPDPARDLAWLPWGALALLVLGAVVFAGQVHRANARLRRELGERRRAEAALQASDLQLRSMLRTAMDGVWLLDSAGRVQEANDTACLLHGMDREELLGRSVLDLNAGASAQLVLDQFARVKARGFELFQATHRRRDGTTFPVEVSATHLPDTGQTVACLRDISDRR
jgi:PAS domain S-box-containing protein